MRKRHSTIAANIFVIFHLVALVSWCLPITNVFSRTLQRFLEPYLAAVGLKQKWALFAPEPAKANYYVYARVTFGNGTVRAWGLPPPAKLDLVSRYLRVHYRKFFIDRLRMKSHSFLWPDACHYIAQTSNIGLSHPNTVRLILEQADIPAPGKNAVSVISRVVFFSCNGQEHP
jgi:hypothetical protein